MKQEMIHINYDGFTLEIEYSYSPGHPGSFHEPPEGPEILPEKAIVFWVEKGVEKELEVPLEFLFAFSEDFEEELMELIERQVEARKENF